MGKLDQAVHSARRRWAVPAIARGWPGTTGIPGRDPGSAHRRAAMVAAPRAGWLGWGRPHYALVRHTSCGRWRKRSSCSIEQPSSPSCSMRLPLSLAELTALHCGYARPLQQLRELGPSRADTSAGGWLGGALAGVGRGKSRSRRCGDSDGSWHSSCVLCGSNRTRDKPGRVGGRRRCGSQVSSRLVLIRDDVLWQLT